MEPDRSVERVVAGLTARVDFHTEVSDQATGLLMATRVAVSPEGSGMIGR